MNKFKINNRGMTLLEIAISMAILTIAIVALVNLFPIGLKASRRASNFSEASILAQRVIENIKRAASIYDGGDHFASGVITTNTNGIGYFELANAPNTAPFYDPPDATITVGTLIHCKYNNTDMNVYINVEDWDANGDGRKGRLNGDWDDVLLSQKVSVGIYWIEGERERADTFITYISNPFYEKYK